MKVMHRMEIYFYSSPIILPPRYPSLLKSPTGIQAGMREYNHMLHCYCLFFLKNAGVALHYIKKIIQG
jgi:hypothetical protein